MPFRTSCQACGSRVGVFSPASVVVSGTMPSVATTTGPWYRADWISRVSHPSRPKPLTTKSWACANRRTWSGLGSNTCSFALRPTRLVTATSLPPTSCTMSSRMLNDTTTRRGAFAAKLPPPDAARVNQRAASNGLERTRVIDRGYPADRFSRQRQDNRAQSCAERARHGRDGGDRQRIRRNRHRPSAGRTLERGCRLAQQRLPLLHGTQRHCRHVNQPVRRPSQEQGPVLHSHRD